MLKIVISITTFVSLCLLVVFLNVTTPATAGPFGVLTIFIFTYLLSLGLITYFLYGMSRVIAYLSTMFVAKKPFETLTFKRSYYYSTVVAVAPVMLIGLQSVGAVGFYELLLVFIFTAVGCLYVSRRVH